MQQLENNGVFKPVKFTYSNKLKHQLNLKVTGNLLVGRNNKKSILCTIENITTQTKLEKRLKNTITASREKNDQLLNFAHMVSHNLKTHATNF